MESEIRNDKIKEEKIPVEDRGPVAEDLAARTEGQEKPLEAQPPLDYGSPYISLEQAAFIMQESEEVLLTWIEKGLLLAMNIGHFERQKRYLIHQSEINRFRHPWKHIWRLDERISGLQKLIVQFKKHLNDRADNTNLETLRLKQG